MALSAHLNAQAAKFCWPAPEDLSALDLHALLFSTPSSPGSDAVAFFAIRIVPPSPQAVEPRGAGPLGPAGELNIVTELLLRLQEAGIESPADRARLASLLAPGLATHLLQHLRGGSSSQNEALRTDTDAIAYGRISLPIGPHISTMLHQQDILSKEQAFLRTLLTAAKEARRSTTQAAEKAAAEARRLRSEFTAAEETIKELRRAQEKAMADVATERKKVQRLHVALDIEKEDVEELHSKYDNLMTVKLMLEDQIDDIEISQLNKAYASTQTDSMGEQDTIAQLKFELAQAERNASTE
ncbi:hypothetical protein OC835_004260 [Tilletia horrida]|nr:hypothetical protein OC835_004260 [Tilletia horrida]